jgi:hypothetical protein
VVDGAPRFFPHRIYQYPLIVTPASRYQLPVFLTASTRYRRPLGIDDRRSPRKHGGWIWLSCFSGGKEVTQVQSDTETDDQLGLILYDTADWAVVGQEGQSLCFAASLRRALDRAADLAADGAVVTALSRLPFDNIIVNSDQMRRLRKVIAGLEVAPIKYSEAWADIDDDLHRPNYRKI